VGLFSTVGSKLSSFFTTSAQPTALTSPNGGDGVQAYGGYLASSERNPHLVGTRKWTTYANATNTSIVATGLRYSLGLIAGTSWHAEPNERGGSDAERGVEIVTEGLLNAQMARPWSAIVRKAALYKFSGFSLHEWTIKRRDDGMVVFADISHRPQYTIDRWNKPDERTPWDAVSQLTPTGNRWVIPRNRLFYCVDDTLTDSPDGVGLFRHIVELVRRLDVLEGLELMAYQTDLRGMPIGRAPIGDIRREAEGVLGVGGDKAKEDAFIAARVRKFSESLAAHAKTPEQLQYLLLDSGTYRGGGSPDAITSIQKWAFELLRGDGNGTAEVAAAIGRIQFEIARVMGIEFAMMGGGGGSLAMHDDKTSMLALNLQTTLTEVADFATNDLARVLVALNGLDPETCTPRLVAEPISTDAIEGVCRSLSLLQQLAPNDPARNVIRKRLRVPPEPEPTPEMMGVLGGDPYAEPTPDPAAGEEDVPLDDLGGRQEAA